VTSGVGSKGSAALNREWLNRYICWSRARWMGHFWPM
jgi:hypothetical protein